MAEKTEIPKALKVCAAIVALIGGLVAMGLVAPWNAVAEDDFRDYKEDHSKTHGGIERKLGEINGKLDVLIQNIKE